jgi:hypothetical protein
LVQFADDLKWYTGRFGSDSANGMADRSEAMAASRGELLCARRGPPNADAPAATEHLWTNSRLLIGVMDILLPSCR